MRQRGRHRCGRSDDAVPEGAVAVEPPGVLADDRGDVLGVVAGGGRRVRRDEDPGRDPFGDERIEVDEDAMTRVNPVAWTRRVTGRLNRAVESFVYGR